MRYLIAGILMSLSLVSAVPKGAPSVSAPIEVFPAAAGTCQASYTPCTNPYQCCNLKCRRTSVTSSICVP